ncbi:MAG TPA: hypothetical protein VJ570_08745 [Holophagaceae bacterium]|nr:hypothetical protein [Holophagaceae bacterium]
MRIAGAALLLCMASGCASRKVDVTFNGRRAESLQGRATKEDGRWTVDLDLPMGRWGVDLPEEGIAVRVREEGGRPHARWETSGERLLAKPFRIRLRPLEGPGEPIWMEVRGRFVGQGVAEFTASVFGALGRAPAP